MSAFNRHAINNPVLFDPSQDRSLFPVEDRAQQQHQLGRAHASPPQYVQQAPAPVYVQSAPPQAPAPIIVHTNAPAPAPTPAPAPIIVHAGRGRRRPRRRRRQEYDVGASTGEEDEQDGEEEYDDSGAETEDDRRVGSRMTRRAKHLRSAILGSRSLSSSTLLVCVMLVLIVLAVVIWWSGRRRDSYAFAPGPMMQHANGAWMPTAMVMQPTPAPPAYVYGGASVGDTVSMASRPIVSHYVSPAPWTPLMPSSSLAL